MIAIVDTGGANLASLLNAFQRLERQAVVTSDPATIQSASHVILPGVGAAEDSMARLKDLNLVSLIPQLTQPVLGICLGMQLLFSFSEEGQAECLNLLKGRVTRIPAREGFPVPHMGWNQVKIEKNTPLMRDLPDLADFYFVHSFVAPKGSWVTGTFEYSKTFTAMVEEKNFFGVQFHPERSGRLGAKLLENFLRL